MRLRYAPSTRFAEYVRKVIACGHWEDAETSTGNHIALLRHIESGRTITYQLHDGGNDTNSARNMARDAEAVCGCKFIEVRGRKASRKKIELTGFDPAKAARENARWADKWGVDVDALQIRLATSVKRMRELAAKPSRSSALEATSVLAEIRELEAQLTRFGQPFTPFCITDLEETA